MASASEEIGESCNITEKNEELCTIEASVVTGFEECARGEAREKFEAEVKASRGKIVWTIPLSRIPEVVKMSSIDNCRVVMHTEPHFKFTDQNDSLARIQKMILDVDWESGLKAWRQLFDFPHPIAPRPDSIPSPEDLVDVVVMTRLPQPKDKSDKKKKNQKKGRGKKKGDDKKQRENKKTDEKQEKGLNVEATSSEKEGKSFSNKIQEDVVEKIDDVNDAAQKFTKLHTHSGDGDSVDIKLEKSDRVYGEDDLKSPDDSKQNEFLKSSSDQEKAEAISDEIPVKSDSAGCETESVADVSKSTTDAEMTSEELVSDNVGDDAKERKVEDSPGTECAKIGSGNKKEICEGEECKVQSVAAPKTVVVKKITSAEMLPKIDIKVIHPENVFPTALENEELRHLEPMEVDSPNASFNLKSTSRSSEKGDEKISSVKGMEKDLKDNDGTELDSPVDSIDINNALPSSPTNIAAAFATSVIKRLSSSPTSPPRENQVSTSCTTPPPTPIASIENPFATSSSSPITQLADAHVSTASSQVSNGDGSSVDPMPYNPGGIPTGSVSLPSELSETSLSTPSITAERSCIDEKTISVIPPVVENCEEIIEATDAIDKEATEDTVYKEATIPVDKEATIPVDKEATIPMDKEASILVDKEATAEKLAKPEPDPTKPKFRVSCNRVGEHPFDSSSAAASFGSAVITYFKWPVDLKKFDIEVLLNIDNEEVSVSIALTKSSLHNRNMVAFGPTTLRPTICYNMLRLCRIKNGDFICDPMCGTSAIPIESALNWTNCFTFGGDFHEKAIERTALNISAVENRQKENNKSHLKLNAVQWNINNFPLRDSCVDVFVSDLPFGHRLGCRTVNRTLYPSLLSEMARTARPGARACLLTEDKTSLIKAIQTYGKLWQRRLVLSINMGGLSGFVFVLIRTTAAIQKASSPAASPVKPTEDNLLQKASDASASPEKQSNEDLSQNPDSPSKQVGPTEEEGK